MNFRFGEEVSFAKDVLPKYVCDFAFGSRDDLRKQFLHADESGRRAILTELKKPVPAPGLCWRYQKLTRELVSGLLMPCRTLPTVADFMARAEREPAESLEPPLGLSGTVVRINSYAAMDDCGVADVYGSMIAVEEIDSKKGFRIFDGTHRICALWKRFTADNWPTNLGVFIGFKD